MMRLPLVSKKLIMILNKKTSLKTMLGLLMFLFIFSQLIFFYITVSVSDLLDILTHSRLTIEILQTPMVMVPALAYCFTQLFIYTLLIILIYYNAQSASRLFKWNDKQVYFFGIITLFMSMIFIVSANSIYFTQSLFALTAEPFHIPPTIVLGLFYFSLAYLLFFVTLSLINLIFVILHKRWQWLDWLVLALILLIAAQTIYPYLFFNFTKSHSNNKNTKPNIIIISIESLRPDYIFKPLKHHITMPALAKLLETSYQFTDNYTAIAQSFPSWVSILTAKTPLHNGARSLYTNYKNINMSESILTRLHNAGYESYYFVDGQRCGDITQALGFDHIISPPYGASELVVGSISDFPLSNLLTLTKIGKILFPYSFANRSLAVTYHINDYLEKIKKTLIFSENKPVFLAIHFGLSHWPFRWANDGLNNDISDHIKYQYSLRAVDEQIEQTLNYFTNIHLLDNAIVVFISDHGIGLGLPGDKLISENGYIGRIPKMKPFLSEIYSEPIHKNGKLINIGIDTSYGYSSDILSFSQYHALMAFKFYPTIENVHNIRSRASLLDVAPTLLDILQLPPLKNIDGISQKAQFFSANNTTPRQRKLFFENGFAVADMFGQKIVVTNVLKNSMSNLKINKTTGLLYLSDHGAEKLLATKQRAILYGDWMLARYPTASRRMLKINTKHQAEIINIPVPTFYVLTNIKTHQWTTDFNSEFAQHSPYKEMMNDFLQYNRGEIFDNARAIS